MSDFFEIDFLDVESNKSGDAIPLRYELNGATSIHVVDGGFQETGDKVVDHIVQFYGSPRTIDHVIVTHPDGDHAAGLCAVLEAFNVKNLWMLRPWLYADELIDRFSRFTSVDNLKRRLREVYPHIANLEALADSKGIPIQEPFQGARIGAFTVLAPAKARYLDLVVASERTPESLAEQATSAMAAIGRVLRTAVAYIRAVWGAEAFSPQETTAENEMSIVQYANICGKRILLTGDVGRIGLVEAANYAPYVGLALPGIDRFQVPHHGSRRNVSTEILDRWLGPRLATMPAEGTETFTAAISSAKKDEDHPRKAVIRAMVHRGGRVFTSEGVSFCTSLNAPPRGWATAQALQYPEEQEE
jgi:hypothetical protein